MGVRQLAAHGVAAKFLLSSPALGCLQSDAVGQEVPRFSRARDRLYGRLCAGGGYDAFARCDPPAHLFVIFTNQPKIIVQNMPGAGSPVLANHTYNISVKAGTRSAPSTRRFSNDRCFTPTG